MKNKVKFLIKESIKKKVDTKWFKIINIILLILMVGILNIDKIIHYFGGDFEDITKVYVLDETGYASSLNDLLNNNNELLNGSFKFEVENSTDTIENLTNKLNKDNTDIVINIVYDNEEYMKSTVYSYEPLDTITSTIISNSLSEIKSSYALATSGIDANELNRILSPISMEKIVTNTEELDSESRELAGASMMLIFLIPFFILIILLVQMIGAEINDEKSTKSMEIIISNVSPKMHFLSKIVASTGFVLLQSFLILVYTLLGGAVRVLTTGSFNILNDVNGLLEGLNLSSILPQIGSAIPLLIILFIFSFLAYALLAGILASMTTSIEDYQQLQTPLMFLLMAGYYIGIMASMFQGSIFIKIVSYIPFISCLVAPITYALMQTTLLDLGISVILLLGTCYLLFKYGIRIYKVGILNYSSSGLWKKMFKSLRGK